MGLIKSLSLGIGVNNKPLKKGLRQSTKEVSSWSSSIGSIAIGTGIGNLVAGGITKSLGVVSGGIQSAFSFAIRDEQLETAFSTLLGGAEQAKIVLGDLRDFGANTPFEFPGIADSAKKLISFGFEQKSLIPTLTKLGDVAAGLDIPFSDLADIYGKARVAGRVMSEDLNQLAGRGIPIFDELAKVMGVTAGEIKGLASKGKIGFGELEQAFGGMTGEGGKFSSMMAAQSQTAGGLISTLKDNINLKLGQIGAGIMKTFNIKGLIGRAIGFIQGFGPTLDWLIEQAVKLQPVFTQTFNLISAYVTSSWNVISGVFGAIGSLFSGFGSVTMDGFVRGMVKGLATIEFAYMNWQKVGILAFKKMTLGVVSFGNKVMHVFNSDIPYTLAWLGRNWEGVWMTAVSNTLTMVENMVGNIVGVMTNLPGLIAGTTTFDSVLTPLSKGMLNIVDEAFELPQRIEGGLEKMLREDMERLQSELGNGLNKHVEMRLGELFPGVDIESPEIKPPEVPTPDPVAIDATGGSDVAKQFADLAEAGTQEYRDAILRFRGLGGDKQDVAKEQRDIAKQQLAAQEETNKLLAGNQAQPVFSIPGG